MIRNNPTSYFSLQSNYQQPAYAHKPNALYMVQFCTRASHLPCIVGFEPANQYQLDE
jgi:hypothetical protein